MAEEHYHFEVKEHESGRRLDKFLADKLGEKFSRTFVQKLISKGDVRVDGVVEKNRHRAVAAGEVEVTVPESRRSALTAEDIKLDIVYEDDHLLVINKPEGMVVHPAPGNYSGTMVNALLAHCNKLSSTGGETKPGIVHRIDKGTSGLLVVAKTDEAHRKLSKQFKNKTARRTYVALVRGVMELDNGIIELPIGRSSQDRKKMAIKFEEGREAVTRYHVLERFKDTTLVELTLGTGRTHQIRVHMSHIGHPVMGDAQYGYKGDYPRPALHAKTIGFVHPATKEYVEFSSKLPKDMQEMIKRAKV